MTHQSIIVTDKVKADVDSDKAATPLGAGTIRVGLSACLAGEEVRYNGGHTQSRLCLNRLSKYFTYTTFCPEVAAGFGTPRPTMRLIGDPQAPKLVYSNDESVDLSAQLVQGFEHKMSNFEQLDAYILMKNSPSCGLERIKVYQENGYPHKTRTQGVFASALKKAYPLMPIEEEGRLHDARLCENFVLRVYAYRNFRQEVLPNPTMCRLLAFHSSYKYILMAHHQASYKKLGRMLGQARGDISDVFIRDYFEQFMAALEKPANKKNHTNTLIHMAAYLKASVPPAVRKSIMDVIVNYRQGFLPLSTPLTLLKHYLKIYGSDYICQQRYLEPYPESLGLANYV